jgi:integrase
LRLTDLSIPKLPIPEKGAKVYADDTLPGFGVRVTSAGVRAFVWTHGRSRTRETLGRVGIISLRDARQKCRELAAAKTLNQYKPKSLTFAAALDLFRDGHLKTKNRPSTARETERLLRKAIPRFGRAALSEITTSDIAAFLDTLPAERRNTFAAVRLFFRFATARRYIPHSPLEGIPAPKAGEKDRILSPGELVIVWKAAEKLGYPFGTICHLLITTGQRRHQISALRAEYVDRAARLIKWPAVTMKNNRGHLVPYSDLTASILVPLPSEGFLFPARGTHGPFTGFSKATRKVYILCNIPPFTLHDLRRTYASTMQAQGVRLEVTERLLSHVSGSLGGIVGLYQRHSYEPEMRQAQERYENFLRELLSKPG